MEYDWTQPNLTLETIKANITQAIEKELKWYTRYRRQHSFFSRSIRVIAIILFATGILWPVVQPDWPAKWKPTFNLGYISLAFGGLLLLLDKYLGISSGYVRFYIAELDIKKHSMDFTENWALETAKGKDGLSLENIVNLLNILKSFRQAVFTTIQVETGAWASEFQAQTGELYELFKQKQNEYIKSAHISVQIENYSGYTNIMLGLDQNDPIDLHNKTSMIFKDVGIGPHLIFSSAKKDGKTTQFSKNIMVSQDKPAELIIKLP